MFSLIHGVICFSLNENSKNKKQVCLCIYVHVQVLVEQSAPPKYLKSQVPEGRLLNNFN